MKIVLALIAACAIATLGGCSSSPEVEAVDLSSALAWQAPNAERVGCGELLAEWSDGAEGSPAACWLYLSTFDAAVPFAEQLASFTEHIGAEPLDGALCMPHASGGFVQCSALWKTPDGFLTLSSGINVDGLRQALESPEAADLRHELLVHTSTIDPRTDGTMQYLTTPLPDA